MVNRKLQLIIACMLCLFGIETHAQEAMDLSAARALWQSAQDGDYRYSYQKFCDCYASEPPTTVVQVTAGRVDSVFHLHDDTATEVPARDGSLELYWTVEDLFSKLELAYQREATVRVTFDAEAGFPTSLFIDYYPDVAGDETDLRLTDFERL